MEAVHHLLRLDLGNTWQEQMGLRHQEEQIFLTVDPQG